MYRFTFRPLSSQKIHKVFLGRTVCIFFPDINLLKPFDYTTKQFFSTKTGKSLSMTTELFKLKYRRKEMAFFPESQVQIQALACSVFAKACSFTSCSELLIHKGPQQGKTEQENIHNIPQCPPYNTHTYTCTHTCTIYIYKCSHISTYAYPQTHIHTQYP